MVFNTPHYAAYGIMYMLGLLTADLNAEFDDDITTARTYFTFMFKSGLASKISLGLVIFMVFYGLIRDIIKHRKFADILSLISIVGVFAIMAAFAAPLEFELVSTYPNDTSKQALLVEQIKKWHLIVLGLFLIGFISQVFLKGRNRKDDQKEN